MFKKINPSAVKWLGFFVAALAIFVSLPEFATMQSQTKLDFKDPRKTGVSASVAESREQASRISFERLLTNTNEQRNNSLLVNNLKIESVNSPNSGGLWSQQASGTTRSLNAVHFLDENHGWIAGEVVTLLKTANGGNSWAPVTNTGVQAADGFNSIRMLDHNTIWSGGDHSFIRTTDSGATWAGTDFVNSTLFFKRLYPTSFSRTWAVGFNNTTGQGVHVRLSFPPSGGGETLRVFTGSTYPRDIQFLDANNGWSVGGLGSSSLIFRITNADGENPLFTPQTSGTIAVLNGIYMLDLNTGWIVGDGGTILKTTNGGANWIPQTSGTTQILNAVYFVNQNVGWAVGNNGLILTTSNGGSTWESEASSVVSNLRGIIVFGSGIGYAVGTNGTIIKRTVSNASTIQFSSANYSINENGGSATITVTRAGGSGAFSVNYTTSNGTATAGQDYAAASGTFNFAANETSKTFTIPIVDDASIEDHETVNLTLTNPTGGAILAAPSTAVLTILNNDLPSASINDVSVNEGNSSTTSFTFNVTLSGPINQNVLVSYGTSNGTAVAPTDYQTANGTLTFNPNETNKQITILVNGDTTVEPNENLFVNLTPTINVTIADGQGIGVIVNDDGCIYSINPSSQNFPMSGGSNSVQVTAPGGCAWSAAPNSFAGFENNTGNQNLLDSTSDPDLLISPQSVFTNPALVTITAGTPYQSDITVSGVSGIVTDINVKLNGVTHIFPNEIDLLLVSPTGRQLVLQSDVGGSFPGITNLTYTLDDQAAAGIPANGPFPADNGSIKPSSLGNDETFPPPAPPPPWNQPAPAGTSTLNGVFGGDAPNGVWKLFAFDDTAVTNGVISGGWTLEITTQGGATNWISITSGQTGDGIGTVNYSVAQNSTGQSRTGTLIIAGQTFTVNQSSTQTRKQFDFDGDGKADYGVFRPSNGVWYLQNSTAGFYGAQFGISTDKIAPADFDGDGKTDIAVFRAGIWHILGSQTGYSGIQFGQAGDIPVPGDFDGDGKADPAVYRGGVWHILRSQSGYTGVQFGVAADKPVAADYDGDGRTDPAVARQASGLSVWHILGSNQGYTGVQFGIETDKLVPADYDGDGKTDPAVYRGGTWYLLRSQLGFTGIQFGIAEDKTAAGDYDGDGKADVAVWRPSSGVFHVLRSQTGYTGVQFGQNADLPVASAFVP